MQALAAMRFIDDVLERNDFEQMSRSLAAEFITDLLQKFELILPKVNIYYCKLIQALIPFVDPVDAQTLLKLHLEAEECVRICYPHNHPALGFHLRNIGIFSRILQQLETSLKYFKEAESIFNFVMPSDHSLAQTLKLLNKSLTKTISASQELHETLPLEVKPVPRFKIQVEQEFLEDQIVENHQVVKDPATEPAILLEIPSLLPIPVDIPINTPSEEKNVASGLLNPEATPTLAVPQLLVPPPLIIEDLANELKIEIHEPESNTSPLPQSPKKTLSPQHDSTGVKKKACLKKFSPRARTPLPPMVSSSNKESSEEEDKNGETSEEAGVKKKLDKENELEVLELKVPDLKVFSKVDDTDELILQYNSKKKNKKRN
uniref:Uncharacterized protein n=1 Tax=Ditylenchus dipsaci TaxID=166011 RepID=A0A915EGW9_9BILA